MDIGPAYIKLPDVTKPLADQRIFKMLKEDEKINFLKELRKDTPPVASIKMLACQNIKAEKKNYCAEFCKHKPSKKICESGIENKHVFFYIDESNSGSKPPNPLVYLLVFTENTSSSEIQNIVDEIKITVEWLEIVHNKICCYIYRFFPPMLLDTNLEGIRGIFEDETGFECEPRNLNPYKSILISGGGQGEFSFTVVDPVS
jgi:hypothetical protein